MPKLLSDKEVLELIRTNKLPAAIMHGQVEEEIDRDKILIGALGEIFENNRKVMGAVGSTTESNKAELKALCKEIVSLVKTIGDAKAPIVQTPEPKPREWEFTVQRDYTGLITKIKAEAK
jgi:hypothetical protein